ncbi:ATPase, partial [Mesorhizobium sp. M7A.F.Ca.CA.004.02.1.1]
CRVSLGANRSSKPIAANTPRLLLRAA